MLIFTGRFQPFHNGHLSIIDRLRTLYPQEIICVAIIKDTPIKKEKTEFDKIVDRKLSKDQNPFPADVTIMLVNKILKNLAYDNVVTTLMPRAASETWEYIISLFDNERTWVFTKNTSAQDDWEDEKCHFYESQGEKVIRIPIEKEIEGTIIRQAIRDREYDKLVAMVPKEVLSYIIKHSVK